MATPPASYRTAEGVFSCSYVLLSKIVQLFFDIRTEGQKYGCAGISYRVAEGAFSCSYVLLSKIVQLFIDIRTEEQK